MMGSAGGFCKCIPFLSSCFNCSSTRKRTWRLVVRFFFGRSAFGVGLFGGSVDVALGAAALERVLRDGDGVAGFARVLVVGGLCGTSCVALMGVLLRVLRWWTRFVVRNVVGSVGSAVLPPVATLGADCVSTLGGPCWSTLGALPLSKMFVRSRSAFAWRTFCSAVVGIVARSSRMRSAAAVIVKSPSEIVGITQCAGKI